VDDPEVRAKMAVASPRISRRVKAVMDSPGVRDAISAVSDGSRPARAEGLRELSPRRNRRR
jgi:hypothetical protein